MGILQQIWLYEIIEGMLLMCQNTTMRVYGAWITYYILCQKLIATLAMCHNPTLVRNKPLGAPASVKLVSSEQQMDKSIKTLKSAIYNETNAKRMNC